MRITVKARYLFLCLIIITLSLSCKKENRWDCIKSTGTITEVQRQLSDFSEIEVEDRIKVVLIQDTINQCRIKAGENLLPKIRTEVVNGKLMINNRNRCNFMRSYKPQIEVYVHFKNLYNINFYGAADLVSVNTIKVDTLYINSQECIGDIDLTVDVHKIKVSLHTGLSDITIKGNAKEVYAYSRGTARLFLQNLESDFVWVNNFSVSDISVKPMNRLEAANFYKGNVFYFHEPVEKDIQNTGEGKVEFR
jgi:hypothetical protein